MKRRLNLKASPSNYAIELQQQVSSYAQDAMAFSSSAQSHAARCALDSVLALLAQEDKDEERMSAFLGSVTYHADRALSAYNDAERCSKSAYRLFPSASDAEENEYVMIARDEADNAFYFARAAVHARDEVKSKLA
jgi:hypothetical protein